MITTGDTLTRGACRLAQKARASARLARQARALIGVGLVGPNLQNIDSQTSLGVTTAAVINTGHGSHAMLEFCAAYEPAVQPTQVSWPLVPTALPTAQASQEVEPDCGCAVPAAQSTLKQTRRECAKTRRNSGEVYQELEPLIAEYFPIPTNRVSRTKRKMNPHV